MTADLPATRRAALLDMADRYEASRHPTLTPGTTGYAWLTEIADMCRDRAQDYPEAESAADSVLLVEVDRLRANLAESEGQVEFLRAAIRRESPDGACPGACRIGTCGGGDDPCGGCCKCMGGCEWAGPPDEDETPAATAAVSASGPASEDAPPSLLGALDRALTSARDAHREGHAVGDALDVAWRSADCRTARHSTCTGEKWDGQADHGTPCGCTCHGEKP
jgi:hypothetical protein